MGTGPPKAGAGIRRVAAGLVSKKAIGKEVVQRAAGNKQDRDCAREGSLRNFYPFLRNEPPSDHDDRNNEQQQAHGVSVRRSVGRWSMCRRRSTYGVQGDT